MDPNDVPPDLDSQTSDASNPPLPWAGASTSNHAIALQQSQFQQLLVSTQLLIQQQAAAHAARFKAAAERVAEISKRFNGEKNDVSEEISEKNDVSEEISPVFVPKKEEEPELKSHPQSPSPPRTFKSKSRSPIRYRNSHRQNEEYLQTSSSRWSQRSPSSYSRYSDNRNDSVSSYRGDIAHSGDRRYDSYSRNARKSEKVSPLSRSTTCRRDDSGSRRHSRIRSPSPRSGQRISPRAPYRRNRSRSPINPSRRRSSPRRGRKGSPRHEVSKRSVSSSEKNPGWEEKVDNVICNIDGGISKQRNELGESAIYPPPETNEGSTRAGKELNVSPRVIISNMTSKSGAKETAASPKPREYSEKRFSRESKPRQRITEHHKNHHRKHHRGSDSVEDDKREIGEKQKTERLESKVSKHKSDDAREMERKFSG